MISINPEPLSLSHPKRPKKRSREISTAVAVIAMITTTVASCCNLGRTGRASRNSFQLRIAMGAITRRARSLLACLILFSSACAHSVDREQPLEFLNRVGTNFHISDEQADALIAAGRQVLRESPEFQTFLARIRGGGSPE